MMSPSLFAGGLRQQRHQKSEDHLSSPPVLPRHNTSLASLGFDSHVTAQRIREAQPSSFKGSRRVELEHNHNQSSTMTSIRCPLLLLLTAIICCLILSPAFFLVDAFSTTTRTPPSRITRSGHDDRECRHRQTSLSVIGTGAASLISGSIGGAIGVGVAYPRKSISFSKKTSVAGCCRSHMHTHFYTLASLPLPLCTLPVATTFLVA